MSQVPKMNNNGKGFRYYLPDRFSTFEMIWGPLEVGWKWAKYAICIFELFLFFYTFYISKIPMSISSHFIIIFQQWRLQISLISLKLYQESKVFVVIDWSIEKILFYYQGQSKGCYENLYILRFYCNFSTIKISHFPYS